MSITVYFGKINLISDHIYKVYDKKISIRDVMSDVLLSFHHGLEFKETYYYIGKDGKQHEDSIGYRVSISEKTDTYIYGTIYRKSKLFYKELNDKNQELDTRAVNNTDAIRFYFDVFNEMVGYHTTQRFGHKKFLEVFGKLINIAVKEKGLNYEFNVGRYTNGIDISQLKNELSNIKNIQYLKFSFQPANPDTQILDSIDKNGKGYLEDFQEANLSTKSVLLSASGKLGININSKIVQEQIDIVNNLQKNITTNVATKYSYAKVEAEGIDGISHSTEDMAPVKKKIDKMEEFKLACMQIIRKKIEMDIHLDEE